MAAPLPSSSALTGVNVVGYHGADSGLGVIARSITRSFTDAGIDVIAIDVAETLSPAHTGSSGDRSEKAPDGLHPVTVAVVTAAQLPAVAERYPEPFDSRRLRIGYWFWELSIVPATQAPAFEHIDRIWTPSRFVRDAYRTAGSTPVDLQPPYIPEPQASQAGRSELGLPEAFTFLTSFDYLSVVERKNPTTVIMCFREAFPNRDDVALVVKSINAEHKPAAVREVRDAAAGDARIILLDTHLDTADHAALVANADCFVSLHRSEGLGLHLAEAMWLGTPVLATGYSGNLDLMDEDSAALVEASLTPVLNGEGAYPEGELWGQPNIIEATEWMRRLRADDAIRAQLGAAGRARMEAQPASAVVGRRMAAAIAPYMKASRQGGAVGTRLRGAARGATSPVRGFFNAHFEMTKDEVRSQTEVMAERYEHSLESLRVTLGDSIASLAKVVADVHVHQTRSAMDLRSEIVEMQQQLAEFRQDLNVLTEALVRLSESDPRPR
jgi:glycosyltransferase involved in cell wall biosynthesis